VRAILMAVASATMVGCASTKGYFVDRGRDAADIFTVAVGRGVGVKAKIGPIQTGLIVNEDVFALRGGEVSYWPAFSPVRPRQWGERSGRPVEALLPLPMIPNEELILYGGGEEFGAGPLAETRGKTFSALNVIPLFPSAARIKDNTCHTAWPYYTQIECVIGLGPSFRLGLNPGEFLDFILGWMTVDIFNDDLERKKRNAKAM